MLRRETFSYQATSSWCARHLRREGIPFNWHYHQEFELTLTLNSAGERYIGNRVSPYSSPDLILIAPDQPHTWKSHLPSTSCEVFVILIPQTWFTRQLAVGMEEYRPVSQLFALASPAIHFSSVCAQRSEPLFRAITRSDSPLTRLSLLATLFELLLEDYHRGYLDDARQPLPWRNQRVEKILHYLGEHFCRALTLQQVADVAHCSISAVKRDLTAYAGLSFSGYLLLLRVDKACFLLKTTQLPLSVIAEQCGFQGVNYFCRKFSQVVKATPSAYRRAYQAISLR